MTSSGSVTTLSFLTLSQGPSLTDPVADVPWVLPRAPCSYLSYLSTTFYQGFCTKVSLSVNFFFV